MENEEIQTQEEAVELEEQAIEETVEEVEVDETDTDDDNVTLSKSEFTKLKRQAFAYKANKTEKPLPKQATQETKTISEERLERIELMQEGYSRDEVDEIMELGGRDKLDNPIVQSAIKAMRAEKKSKEASQPLSSKSPVFKKYTQEDFSKMTAAEMEKILQG